MFHSQRNTCQFSLFLLKVVSVNLYLAKFICLIIYTNFATILRIFLRECETFLGKNIKIAILYQKNLQSQFLPGFTVCMVTLMQETGKTPKSSNLLRNEIFTEISEIAFFKKFPHIFKILLQFKPKLNKCALNHKAILTAVCRTDLSKIIIPNGHSCHSLPVVWPKIKTLNEMVTVMKMLIVKTTF